MCYAREGLPTEDWTALEFDYRIHMNGCYCRIGSVLNGKLLGELLKTHPMGV